MITEAEYLQALEIVKAYQEQINKQIIDVVYITPDCRIFDELKKGDLIKITEVSGLSNLIKIGNTYRVVSFDIWAENKKDFDKFIDKNYAKEKDEILFPNGWEDDWRQNRRQRWGKWNMLK